MSTSHDDLIEPSTYIHWPDGSDLDNADLFAHNAIVIDAPAESIWAKLTDAAAWPRGRRWNTPATSGTCSFSATTGWA